MRWASLRTQPKIIIGMALPMVFLVALSLAALASVTQIMSAKIWVNHTYSVLAKASAISAAAVDMETGMRGYLLAGQEKFLEPYHAGEQATYAAISDLKNTVSDNSRQVERLNQAEGILRAWQANVTEPMITLRRQVGADKTMQDIADLVGQARGKTYFNQFRDVMADFAAEEQALMTQRKAESERIQSTVYAVLIGGMIVAIGAGGVIGWAIGGSIARPIQRMTRFMSALADGDKSQVVPGVDRGDEIGEMAAAVQVFKDSMIKADHMAAQEAEQAELRLARTKKIEQLTQNFDQQVGSVLVDVTDSATEMEHTAVSMTDIAGSTIARATGMAATTNQANANVQTVATATEELTASIYEIGRQVAESSHMATAAAEEAAHTDTQVQGLSESAVRIGEVVSLITEIAQQTNLLALNASIEAARAGEHGKGFAVVASEVKSLASETAKATQEIETQIASIQQETDQAVDAIRGIAETIRNMDEITSAIAAAVEQQGAATGEIARNVEQAAVGTQDVTDNITEVSSAATNTGTAAEQVTGVARALNNKADMLKAQVDRFLTEVRAV